MAKGIEAVYIQVANRAKRAKKLIATACSRAADKGLLKQGEVWFDEAKTQHLLNARSMEVVKIKDGEDVKIIPLHMISSFGIFVEPNSETVYVKIEMYDYPTVEIVLGKYEMYDTTEEKRDVLGVDYIKVKKYKRESLEKVCDRIREAKSVSKEDIITLAETVKKTKIDDLTSKDVISFQRLRREFKENQYINRIDEYLKEKIVKNS